MFGRDLTAKEEIKKSYKNINKLGKKRDKLNPLDPEYKSKYDELTHKMADEYNNIEIAKLQLQNPPTQNTTINASVSFNKNDNGKHIHLLDYHAAPKENKKSKKTKRKELPTVAWVVFILLGIAACIGIIVGICFIAQCAGKI